MKTKTYSSFKMLAIAMIALSFGISAKAQTLENYYANIDWQFNFPNSDSFVKKGSGWGMNFEGGYYLTENLSVGAFLTYHSKLTLEFGMMTKRSRVLFVSVRMSLH